MLRTFLGGIIAGVANVIPGVSAGTMLVVMDLFKPLMDNIDNLVHNKSERKNAIIFFIVLFIGVAIGVIGFAKIANWLFTYVPIPTKFWFIGLIVFSIPLFLKQQLHHKKPDWIMLLFGVAVIILLEFLTVKTHDYVPTIPNLSLYSCILLFGMGLIGGAAMILPGISGSMVLLVLGQYYLFKSYLAAITTFSLNVLVPLFCMGIGILIGIVVIARIFEVLLKKYETSVNSFLLGMVAASALVLIPRHLSVYTPLTFMLSVVAFIIGGLCIWAIPGGSK